MAECTPEQIEYYIQFLHPEKLLATFPGTISEAFPALYELDGASYERIKDKFAANVRAAADELLGDADFAARVDRLPFTSGATVVGLGDSITDDLQSWLELLRALVEARRGQSAVTFVNAGISGDTTSQMITRFLGVVELQPEWIICMPGTNDARTHGRQPSKSLVTAEETERNLQALRNFAATQTSAKWTWMTPVASIEEKIATHWLLGTFQMNWPAQNVAAVVEAVRRQSDPVVDLYEVFGAPPNPALLMDDGLHPSLEGQKTIVRALVTKLTS